MKHSRAFTLIELVVYLGLFGILVGRAFVAAEDIVESGGRNETSALLQQEGDFLIAKIEYAFSSGGTIALSGTDMTITEGGAAHVLNGNGVFVTDLVFTHTYAGGVNPESLATSFTLSARTPRGVLISQAFSTVSYIKK